MTFEDAVSLVDELSNKLTKLAYLKDELAQIPDKRVAQEAQGVADEIYDMLEELEESGLQKIREELVVE